MKTAVSPSIVRDLDALYQVGAIGALSDRELLSRFRGGPDAAAERAFEAIVERHGPMVLGVCRRAVRDEPAAEDAFQATFLVLALRAGSIRRHESLGPWLHGVAARIARRARARASRRARESTDPVSLAAVPIEVGGDEIEAAELRAVLDEEIGRLPAAYRRAIILCYLEGKTQEAAARELGWSKGTVSGRLARAKDLLRVRLARRGVAPIAGLAGAVLAAEEARAAVPAKLAREAIRAGLNAALGSAEALTASGAVAMLAAGALRTMLLGRVASAVAALAVLLTVASTIAQTSARPGRAVGETPTARSAAARPQPAVPQLPPHARARLGTSRLRHEFYTSTVAFAPDGKTLASTGWDGTARFWDLKTGEPAANLPRIAGAGRTLSVAYSPDGTRLALGRDSILQLWDLRTGKEVFRSPAQQGGVREIVFSPDGRTLAAASVEPDPAVRIWDVATGRVRRVLACNELAAYRGRPMSFSPDGKRLAVAASAVVDAKKTVEIIGIWDLDSDSRPVMIRAAQGHNLISLAFAPDGRTLISGGSDSRPDRALRNTGQKLELSPKIKVWDAGTGRPVREFAMGDLTGHCAFTVSRDGRTLISIHLDRLIVWELASARRIRTIPIERNDPGVGIGGCLAVSPDGRTVAASRGNYSVHLWDVETGKPLFQQHLAHEATVTAAAIWPDDRLVATADARGVVILWDAVRGQSVRRIAYDPGEGDMIHSLRIAPDSRTLAAAARYFDHDANGFQGVVRLWEPLGGTLQREFRLDAEPLRLAYSPDGRQLAIAMRDHPNNPPGQRRAPGADDQFQVFDIATGEKRSSLHGRPGPTYALAFSTDGKTLASADADENFDDLKFRRWDLATGHSVEEIPIAGHREGATSRHPGRATRLCAFELTPDLSTAATAAVLDDRVLVWDLRTGRVRRTFQVAPYEFAAMAVSLDGRFLAAGMKAPGEAGRAGAIRIWEIGTKREVLRLEPGSSTVRSLTFSHDGKMLVSGMEDTTVMIWDCSAARDAATRP